MFLVQLEQLRCGAPEVHRMMSFAALGRFAGRRSSRLKRADHGTSYRIKASGFYKCPDFGTVRSPGSQQ
jgi:hypothetical protein